MPTHKAGRYLSTAIASTLRALNSESRLFVHVDGEDRQAENIIDKYSADGRLRVSKSKKNMGVWRSLNTLSEKIDGDFVSRMDSDDICMPWRFSIQEKLILKSQADLLFSPALMVTSKHKLLMPRLLPLRGLAQHFVDPVKTLARYNPLFTSSSFMTLEAFARQTPFEQGFEDYKGWLRCAIENSKMHVGIIPVIAYRRQALQLSRTHLYKSQGRNDNTLIELKDCLLSGDHTN